MKRSWSPLVLSAAAHVLVLAVAAELTRNAMRAELRDQPDNPASESRRIDMIYMPPPEPTPLPAPAPRPQPPPPAARTDPEPEANAPPEARRTAGAESPDDAPAAGAPAGTPAPAPAAPAREKAAATMESEARRIFGRPRLATREGAGPQAVRPMESWVRDNSERCVPRQPSPADATGETQLGTVMGKIFRQDNGRPLAGAHLQMIGTPYVAFTDGSGVYRFRFDMSLVDNCRTQYVKVTASGYQSRLLVLVVGPQVRSEDVRLRRQ